MTLKEHIVVQTEDGAFHVSTKEDHEHAQRAITKGYPVRPYKILATFSASDELKDSPYQGGAGTWRSAAKPPGITQWYVVKCEQRRFASLIYVDSKITLERVAKDIDVEIDLLEWLDDSAATPAGDGLPPDLEEMIKREPVTFFLVNILKYLDMVQQVSLRDALIQRTPNDSACITTPPNKPV